MAQYAGRGAADGTGPSSRYVCALMMPEPSLKCGSAQPDPSHLASMFGLLATPNLQLPRTQSNYFFRLSKYQKEVEALLASEDFVQPVSRRNEVRAAACCCSSCEGLAGAAADRERARERAS